MSGRGGQDQKGYRLELDNEELHAFLRAFYNEANLLTIRWGVSFPGERAVATTTRYLKLAIEQLENGEGASLPFRSSDEAERINWLDVAPTSSALLAHRRALRCWLGGTYRGGEPSYGHRFDPQSDTVFQRLGAGLFPHGYDKWWCTTEQARTVVARRLSRMIVMSRKTPKRRAPSREPLPRLLERFDLALATGAHDEAAGVIHQIATQGLAGHENVDFLRIALHQAAGQWSKITGEERFVELVRVGWLPVRVREAILEAVYESELVYAELEGELEDVREVVSHHSLLEPSVTSSAEGIERRGALSALAHVWHAADRSPKQVARVLEDGHAQTRELLGPLIPADTGEASEESPVEVRAESRRSVVLSSREALTIEAVNRLAQAAAAEGEHRRAGPVQERGEERVTGWIAADAARPLELDHIAQKPLPTSWRLWFRALLERGDDLSVMSRDALASFPVTGWTPREVEELTASIEQLLEALAEAETSPALGRRFADVLPHLIHSLVHLDEGWPRQVYRPLYGAVVLSFEWLPALGLRHPRFPDSALELADGLLSLDGSDEVQEQVAGLLGSVFEDLQPRHLLWALDALELLRDLGVAPGRARLMMERVKEVQQSSQRDWEKWTQRRWVAVARWSGSDESFARELFPVHTESPPLDPIAALGPRRVIVLTLEPPRARAARARLLERNPELDMVIREDKAFSKDLRSALDGADLIVLVHRAAKHAVSSGLTEAHRAKTIRPATSGSSAIVACLEEHALEWRDRRPRAAPWAGM